MLAEICCYVSAAISASSSLLQTATASKYMLSKKKLHVCNALALLGISLRWACHVQAQGGVVHLLPERIQSELDYWMHCYHKLPPLEQVNNKVSPANCPTAQSRTRSHNALTDPILSTAQTNTLLQGAI